MPNGGIVVNYATIQGAADDCNATGKEIEQLFEELKSQLAPLTDSWTGEAQNAWNDRQRAWNADLEDMKSLLARIAIALPEIADGYQSTDKGIQGMF